MKKKSQRTVKAVFRKPKSASEASQAGVDYESSLIFLRKVTPHVCTREVSSEAFNKKYNNSIQKYIKDNIRTIFQLNYYKIKCGKGKEAYIEAGAYKL